MDRNSNIYFFINLDFVFNKEQQLPFHKKEKGTFVYFLTNKICTIFTVWTPNLKTITRNKNYL
ncbi:MAG: hypothetical protein CR994_01820 [Maribacter sp.]|nr:MAG: hypothetical protein CR994_01820 [Maribacter sp.]